MLRSVSLLFLLSFWNEMSDVKQFFSLEKSILRAWLGGLTCFADNGNNRELALTPEAAFFCCMLQFLNLLV